MSITAVNTRSNPPQQDWATQEDWEHSLLPLALLNEQELNDLSREDALALDNRRAQKIIARTEPSIYRHGPVISPDGALTAKRQYPGLDTFRP